VRGNRVTATALNGPNCPSTKHLQMHALKTPDFSAFCSPVCPSGSTDGSASFRTFQRAQKHSSSSLTFILLFIAGHSFCIRKLIKGPYRQQNRLSTQVAFASSISLSLAFCVLLFPASLIWIQPCALRILFSIIHRFSDAMSCHIIATRTETLHIKHRSFRNRYPFVTRPLQPCIGCFVLDAR
jgi:hypothetical protein